MHSVDPAWAPLRGRERVEKSNGEGGLLLTLQIVWEIVIREILFARVLLFRVRNFLRGISISAIP